MTKKSHFVGARIPTPLYEKLVREASIANRSLASQITHELETYSSTYKSAISIKEGGRKGVFVIELDTLAKVLNCVTDK